MIVTIRKEDRHPSTNQLGEYWVARLGKDPKNAWHAYGAADKVENEKFVPVDLYGKDALSWKAHHAGGFTVTLPD